MRAERVSFLQPVSEFIDSVQPRAHLSADWLTDPLALGLLIFPREIYRKMEELQNGVNHHTS